MYPETENLAAYVGRPYEDAVAELQERFPFMNVHAVAIGDAVTEDVRHDRIRVWHRRHDGTIVVCERG